MKLSFNQIKEIVTGVVRIKEENGTAKLYRFTKEQEELYKESKPDSYSRTLSTAGIRLMFKTDSKSLFLKIKASKGSSRTYFSVDVFSDGKLLGYIDNFSDKALPENSTKSDFPLGEFSKKFQMGDGEKNVCVYFPWSVITSIEEISIDDGCFVVPTKPQKKLLAFGDSITHGYDAFRPSNRYVSKLADMLCAEEINKAIGGEVFFPELAKSKEQFVPDYITVAYGTNDWSKKDKDFFKTTCKDFYTSLSANYPDSEIFAITPIWRKDYEAYRPFGVFKKVEEGIKEAVRELKNVTVISGFDLVPHSEKYFFDLRLHPNDEGFEHYFENLYSKIKTIL